MLTQEMTMTHVIHDIPLYPPIRSKWLGDYRPASMLLVIPALVRPEFFIEIEVLAVAP